MRVLRFSAALAEATGRLLVASMYLSIGAISSPVAFSLSSFILLPAAVARAPQVELSSWVYSRGRRRKALFMVVPMMVLSGKSVILVGLLSAHFQYASTCAFSYRRNSSWSSR